MNPMTLPANHIPDLHPQVAARVVNGQAVIVLADSGEVTVINESGTQIWGWIDGKRSVGEIAAALERRYGLPTETALADTDEFLQTMAEIQAVVLRAPAGVA
jgi:hypothetical protein